MNTDRATESIVEAWLADGFAATPDVEAMLDGVRVGVAVTPQRRYRWWPFGRKAAAPVPEIGPASARGFTMLSALKFVAASVIVALVGGFLLTALPDTGTREELAPAAESASLTPSGVEILTPSTGTTEALVADGDGILWAREFLGRLVRFDPDTDTTTTWTLADDIAFGQASSIAPSAKGGVWLTGRDAARLFDGDRFAQVIAAPAPIKFAVEADDATLWAATETGVVLHWDGSDWQDMGPGTCDWITALEVDAAGRPWVGGNASTTCTHRAGGAGGRVMVLDGSGWTRFDESDASPLEAWPRSIMEAPDGSIWVASDGGVARFDGAAWTVDTPGWKHPYGSLAAASDGSVWTRSDNRSGRIWRSDGAEWTKLAGPEGLPDEHWSADLATVGERVFLGTPWGTYELTGDDWKRSWAVAPARSGLPRLAAAGDGELWVADTQGVRHLEDGTWTDELDWSTQASQPALAWSDLALGPGSTVWVAGPKGMAYHDGERWAIVDGREAEAVTVDAQGTVWAVRRRQSGRCHAWALREDSDGAWIRDDLDGCPLGSGGELSLAVAGDDTLWLGDEVGWGSGGLARYAQGEWEAIQEIGDMKVSGGAVLGTDSEGGVWIVLQQERGTRNATRHVNGPVARIDGDDVSVVELPAGAFVGLGWQEGALDADGAPWISTGRGPARFDGRTWQFPYEDTAIFGMQVTGAAADGSIYVLAYGPRYQSDIVRFPAQGE